MPVPFLYYLYNTNIRDHCLNMSYHQDHQDHQGVTIVSFESKGNMSLHYKETMPKAM